jgi:hypothetical protein
MDFVGCERWAFDTTSATTSKEGDLILRIHFTNSENKTAATKITVAKFKTVGKDLILPMFGAEKKSMVPQTRYPFAVGIPIDLSKTSAKNFPASWKTKLRHVRYVVLSLSRFKPVKNNKSFLKNPEMDKPAMKLYEGLRYEPYLEHCKYLYSVLYLC